MCMEVCMSISLCVCVCVHVNVHCSIIKSYWTLCDPMDCNTPGLSVRHHLPDFTQVHVHSIGDAFQSFHPLPPSSPFAFNLSQHAFKNYEWEYIWVCMCVCAVRALWLWTLFHPSITPSGESRRDSRPLGFDHRQGAWGQERGRDRLMAEQVWGRELIREQLPLPASCPLLSFSFLVANLWDATLSGLFSHLPTC